MAKKKEETPVVNGEQLVKKANITEPPVIVKENTPAPPIETPVIPTVPVSPVPPSVEPTGPKVGDEATNLLIDDILKTKPKPEPEAIASALEKKKRGRPPGSGKKDTTLPTKPKVPVWPDGTPIDFDRCELEAEATVHSHLLVLSTVVGDASIVKGQTKEAKQQEDILVKGWKRYYELKGIKEGDPRFALFMGYLGLMSVHMQKPKTRKKVLKKVVGAYEHTKNIWTWIKYKFNSWREGE